MHKEFIMKKVMLSNKTLDENVALLNEFLSQKGMSQVRGGVQEESLKDDKKLEPDWGNTNYCESTRPVRR